MTEIVYERGTAIYKTWLDRFTGTHQRINGSYDPFTDRIRVWCENRTGDQTRKTVRHELQHAHDRWMLIVFKFYVWLDLGLCGILLGQVLVFGNSLAVIVGLIGTSTLWFVSSAVHLWFEERAEKAADNNNPDTNAERVNIAPSFPNSERSVRHFR